MSQADHASQWLPSHLHDARRITRASMPPNRLLRERVTHMAVERCSVPVHGWPLWLAHSPSRRLRWLRSRHWLMFNVMSQ
jgi:hypothetical protein